MAHKPIPEEVLNELVGRLAMAAEAVFDEDKTAIIVCPCCASQIDTDGAGAQALLCNNCGQQLVLVVDPDRQNAFSMH